MLQVRQVFDTTAPSNAGTFLQKIFEPGTRTAVCHVSIFYFCVVLLEAVFSRGGTDSLGMTPRIDLIAAVALERIEKPRVTDKH